MMKKTVSLLMAATLAADRRAQRLLPVRQELPNRQLLRNRKRTKTQTTKKKSVSVRWLT